MKPIGIFISIAILFFACQKQKEMPSNQESHYAEAHRPQFHFSPPAKWMNDPNGLVYYDGEYHLFYQHYPDSTIWGPMHWGHAVSKDLVHWEHLPIALYPDPQGFIFSGSAVIDWNNSSGLGKDNVPPMIAIFTYHNMESEKAGNIDYQTQALAYSYDKGRSWTKYESNPIIPNLGLRDFRDPKVTWYGDTPYERWIMSLAAGDHISFYSSPNLRDWNFRSDFGKTEGAHGGVWECPDLFQLPVEGSDQSKWVLLVSINPGGPNGGSATQYFIGDFEAGRFKSDYQDTLWIDYGRDNYAGVTWSDIPATNGRRIFIGWMSNWQYAQEVPTDAWRSAMTLPRTLSLRQTPSGLRLCSNPVRELEMLRNKNAALPQQAVEGVFDLTAKTAIAPQQMEAILEVELPEGSAADFGLELSNVKGESYRIGYNATQKQYYSDRTKAGDAAFSTLFADKVTLAPRWAAGNTLKLHLFFDVASAELFADDGVTALTDIFFPSVPFSQIKFYSEAGKAVLKKAVFYEIDTIWKK